MRQILLTTALALAAAQTALAEDIALVLGNERYAALGNVARGADVTVATAGIGALGFDVAVLRDGDAESAARALVEFAAAAPGADRLIVALSGRFVTDGARSWLLPADAAQPGLMALAGAVPLESILAVMAGAQGRAVLLLGVDPGDDAQIDNWLRAGIGRLDIPQGVTVLTAPPRDAADFLRDALGAPEGDLAALVARYPRVAAAGYLPQAFAFMPALPDVRPPRVDPVDGAADVALWRRVVAQDNAEAYRGYLRQFPNGAHADEANAALAAILAEPFRDERLAEEALELSRDQRRDIQSDLTTMGFDTRGVDGIFGPGSRRSITNWQQENGFAQTGYVTIEQISRLDAQAARRTAERAVEAERQRQEAERLDRAYWEETGARGDEAGLNAYLGRYPQGLYGDAARDRLAAIAAAAAAEQSTRDREAWTFARERNTLRSYRTYLRENPEGAFVAEARARIAALEADGNGELPALDATGPVTPAPDAAAAATEAALGLNALTTRLVESRLAALGHDPGAADGRIDDDTRRAIRRWQAENGQPETGYLSEQMLVVLLAGVLGGG